MINYELFVIFLTICLVASVGSRKPTSAYDYIIVGAGSSGATLAGRLSEDPDVTVLLLEAGGYPTEITENILTPYSKLVGSNLDWNYTTEAQEGFFLDSPGQRVTYPRGKVLGGSSTINGMLYTRGNRRDYDRWEALGAEGWSYKDVLPYFIKSEDYQSPDTQDTEPDKTDGITYRGKGGPLTVYTSKYFTRFETAFFAAGNSKGLELIDTNGRNQTGVSQKQRTIRDGRRCSTEKAFLRPAYERTNFEVVVYAHVTKVLIDDNKQAYGVQFEVNGTKGEVNATREVILSAGVINSPQILMLSGLGPKEQLEKFNIPLIADLPVGRGFKDKMALSLFYNFNLSTAKVETDSPPMFESRALAFLKTIYANASEDYPDVEINFNKLTDPSLNLLMTAVIGLRPESIGTVELNSSDPYAQPLIDPKVFSSNQDYLTLFEGVKFSISLLKTSEFQSMGVRPRSIKACPFEFGSDEFIHCALRKSASVYLHGTGTCKMGNPNNIDTVLDPQLRVKGIKGLRVVDCSVMPSMPSGHTNAPAIMVGEKAADIIKEQYKPKLSI